MHIRFFFFTLAVFMIISYETDTENEYVCVQLSGMIYFFQFRRKVIALGLHRSISLILNLVLILLFGGIPGTHFSFIRTAYRNTQILPAPSGAWTGWRRH